MEGGKIMWKKICESGEFERVSDEEDNVLQELENSYRALERARSILQKSSDATLRKRYMLTITNLMDTLDFM